MRKHRILLLAAVVALLAAAPVFAAPPADEDLLLCSATATVEEPETRPAEEIEIENLLPPEPVPLACPYNRRCTFVCPDYPGCPEPQCIEGFCVYE